MISNTHGGGMTPMPAAMGGEGDTATRQPLPTYSRAVSPLLNGMAEGCVRSQPLRTPHLFEIAAYQRLDAARKPALNRHICNGCKKPFGSRVFGSGLVSGRFHAVDVAKFRDFSTGNLLRVQLWDHLAGKGKRRSGPLEGPPP